MEPLLPESWVYMHFALILIITCAQMLVIYILGDSSNPPAGLGMYTVYFMAALLGWITFTLQQGSGSRLTVDVASIAAIINSYILFLAAGARSGIDLGRSILGVICLLSALSGLMLQQQQMFLVQVSATTLFFLAAGLICAWHSHSRNNTGEAIIAFSAIIMCTGLPFAIYQLLAKQNLAVAQTVFFGCYSAAYILVTIGFLASVLIEYQIQLAQQTTHDPLSRTYNRRGMEEALQLSIAAAIRHKLTMAAIMVDIDHFKQINTSYGPEIGDQLIRRVGDLLKALSRASDVVARVDGEKFMLVLPETELQAAKLLAERIRAAIGEHPQFIEQQAIAVTVSIGVTAMREELSLDGLSHKADNAMYLAKQGGRNQVASLDYEPLHLSTDPNAP